MLEATHIQVLAEKMGIPLIFNSKVFNSKEFREFSKQNQSFELSCNSGTCRIYSSSKPFVFTPKVQSVLPKNFNRSTRKLYNQDTERYEGRSSRELSGDKFFELMNFKFAFPKRVPDITAVSSGYFENFINNFTTDGFSLRRHFYDLQRDLKRANESGDEVQIQQLLSVFRNKIAVAKPDHPGYDVFKDLMFEIESYYYRIYKSNIATPFSIRSNQDVEDLIAAGLYKSSVAQKMTQADFENSIRLCWSSLFDYRAYTIRRYWGQREANISTSLMIHPYVDQVLSHSLGTFKIDTQNRLSFEINMVLGNSERATNPSANAKVVELQFAEQKPGKFKVHFKPSFAKLAAETQGLVQKDLIPAINNFLNEVHKYIRSDFNEKLYSPTGIHIEFVLQNQTGFYSKPHLLVLQYKPSLNREVILDLLTGLLDREDTDRKSSQKIKIANLKTYLDQLQVKSLAETIPKLYHEYKTQGKTSSPRYALVVQNRNPKLIVWDSPMYHETIKRSLNTSPLKWLKSGYMKIMTRKNSGGHTLLFTETTEDTTDVSLQFDFAKQLFEAALTSAMIDSPELNQLLTNESPEIIFQTHEGQAAVGILMTP
jgi:hypothetical protein